MESDVDVWEWFEKQCHWCLWPRENRLDLLVLPHV